MNRATLIKNVERRQRVGDGDGLSLEAVEDSVDLIIDQLIESIASGQRIEIRGFGSFSLRERRPRTGRNPRTGEAVQLATRYSPRFKPGLALRERVNEGLGSDEHESSSDASS